MPTDRLRTLTMPRSCHKPDSLYILPPATTIDTTTKNRQQTTRNNSRNVELAGRNLLFVGNGMSV